MRNLIFVYSVDNLPKSGNITAKKKLITPTRRNIHVVPKRKRGMYCLLVGWLVGCYNNCLSTLDYHKTKQARSVISLPYQIDQSLYFLFNSLPIKSNSCFANIAHLMS